MGTLDDWLMEEYSQPVKTKRVSNKEEDEATKKEKKKY